MFRGVENQSPEEIERYDEPVIMRLNTRDELELRGGIPRDAAELYGYCAVILDDVEADSFTLDQTSGKTRCLKIYAALCPLRNGGWPSFLLPDHPRRHIVDMSGLVR